VSPAPPVPTQRRTEAAFQERDILALHAHFPAGSDVGKARPHPHRAELNAAGIGRKHGQEGRGHGQPPVALSLFSPNLRSAQWKGWASAHPELLGRRHSPPGPDRPLPVLLLVPSPGRPCPQAGAINSQRRRESQGPVEIEGNALQAAWEWPCRFSATVPASQPVLSVTSSCSLDQRQSVWALQKAAPRHSGRARPPDPATPIRRAGSHHQQRQAGSPSASATFWGSCHLEPLRASVSKIATHMCTSSAQGCPACRYVMGILSNNRDSHNDAFSVDEPKPAPSTGANGPKRNEPMTESSTHLRQKPSPQFLSPSATAKSLARSAKPCKVTGARPPGGQGAHFCWRDLAQVEQRVCSGHHRNLWPGCLVCWSCLRVLVVVVQWSWQQLDHQPEKRSRVISKLFRPCVRKYLADRRNLDRQADGLPAANLTSPSQVSPAEVVGRGGDHLVQASQNPASPFAR